ncbi:MAG: YHS domain-containing protein, partial [Aestuariivirga sp.]
MAQTHTHAHAPDGQSHLVIDPVCGMSVDPHATQLTHVHGGKTYYFCAPGCLSKFAADPGRYLDPESMKKALEALPQDTVFTCPMHPEIEQI